LRGGTLGFDGHANLLARNKTEYGEMHLRRSVSTLGLVLVLANSGANATMIAKQVEFVPAPIVVIEVSQTSLPHNDTFPVFANTLRTHPPDVTTFDPVFGGYVISESRIDIDHSSVFLYKSANPLAIPLPAAFWLFFSALVGLAIAARSRAVSYRHRS
jgi:hypothetical protein